MEKTIFITVCALWITWACLGVRMLLAACAWIVVGLIGILASMLLGFPVTVVLGLFAIHSWLALTGQL